MLSPSKIMSRAEISLVLRTMTRKARRSQFARRRLIIFRLACCCGMRATEACNIRLSDVRRNPILRDDGTAEDCAYLIVRCLKKKRGTPPVYRHIPLVWDLENRDCILSYAQDRSASGAAPDDYLIAHSDGRQYDRHSIRCAFKTCIKVLGKDRARQLSVKEGRHSFATHALHAGVSLVEVQAALGHSSTAITAIYLHLCPGNESPVRRIFGT